MELHCDASGRTDTTVQVSKYHRKGDPCLTVEVGAVKTNADRDTSNELLHNRVAALGRGRGATLVLNLLARSWRSSSLNVDGVGRCHKGKGEDSEGRAELHFVCLDFERRGRLFVK